MTAESISATPRGLIAVPISFTLSRLSVPYPIDREKQGGEAT